VPALCLRHCSRTKRSEARSLHRRKAVERRTRCLQADVELLQQALVKLARATQDKIAASGRDLGTTRAKIAALKSTIEKLNSELAQMKAKAEPPARSRRQNAKCVTRSTFALSQKRDIGDMTGSFALGGAIHSINYGHSKPCANACYQRAEYSSGYSGFLISFKL